MSLILQAVEEVLRRHIARIVVLNLASFRWEDSEKSAIRFAFRRQWR
jgi:hypothetical protein